RFNLSPVTQYVSILITILSFLFTAPASPDIYTLSLHDALPISLVAAQSPRVAERGGGCRVLPRHGEGGPVPGRGLRLHPERRGRSEEHTSELQSRENLVCRLLLEKKNDNKNIVAGFTQKMKESI